MWSPGNLFLFLCVLFDAVLSSPLVEYFILYFLHQKKQADRDWLAPDYPADQWDTMDSPTVEGNPWRPYSTPIEIDL